MEKKLEAEQSTTAGGELEADVRGRWKGVSPQTRGVLALSVI